ncbi:hypothetical protein CPB97_007118 [Podila verticillata]|nr:hypothetical protein CPB97_007118 [Podila verticillata]
MTTEDAPHIQLPIETARLTLDPPSEADDEAMGRMFSDLETMAYLRFKTKEPHGWTKSDIVDRRELQEAGIAKGTVSTYYIHDKRTGELAGVCGANHIHMDERRSDAGIILWKKYWSGGYGTEALYELMRDLFEERKMHKITYETTEPNDGMRRFLEVSCGTPLTYILKDEFMCPSTNKWVSLYAYVIFEEDWPRIKATLLENMKRGAAKHQQ